MTVLHTAAKTAIRSVLMYRSDLMAVLQEAAAASCKTAIRSLLMYRRSDDEAVAAVCKTAIRSVLMYRSEWGNCLRHTAAAASCHIQFLSFTPIHQDWSDGGLTHCCCCLLSHTIPLIHSYTSGVIWWRSYTLLLLPLVTYNSSHSLLYIRTDLMVVLHTAAAASCHIQFLSFTPIHQDRSDGGQYTLLLRLPSDQSYV